MSRRLFAGIDIGGTNIKFGLVDGDGRVVSRSRISTPREDLPESLFAKVLHCGERLLIEADEEDAAVAHIGIGSPGTVNAERGVIEGTCPNLPDWVGFPVRDRLQERLNLPVFVENDAHCAGLAEFRFGAGEGGRCVVCLTVGTGIGGAIIIDGKIHRGLNNAAGEIGHIKVLREEADGAPTTALLESLVSSRAILGRLRTVLADGMTPAFARLIGDDLDKLTIRRVFTAMRKGDAEARRAITETAHLLGVALAGIVNLLNPDMIIIGGGVAEGGAEYVAIIRETIMKEALECATGALQVTPARLGNAAGFIGAAMLGEQEKEAGSGN